MSDFKTIQNAFIAHLRDPEQHSFAYGIEDRRMAVYRELFFNNILGFVDSAFPVLKSLYSQEKWLALVRCFFAEHDCRSPYFVDISKNFVEYLDNGYQQPKETPPFIAELAHYEWLELLVSLRARSPELSAYIEGQPLPVAVQCSPLAELVSYPYPVHQITADFQPQQPEEPVYLVVYRDGQERIQFSELNVASAHLLSLLVTPKKVTSLIQQMSQAMPQFDQETLTRHIEHSLEQFLQQQILFPLGFSD